MAGYALRVKTKNGQQVVKTLTKDSTVKDLKLMLSNISEVPLEKLTVLTGFPPKVIDVSREEESLENSGIKSGDTLIVEERNNNNVAVTDRSNANVEKKEKNYKQHTEDPFDCPGILMTQVVPADNSCLFSSINFVLNGSVDNTGTSAQFMRQLVAESIKSNKESYDEAILGKPIDEYCAWIQDDKSWGGAIELSILSNYFGMEIAVLDTINAIINRFGEDQSYSHRVFLLFDGIHYDPLYLEPLEGGKIQTIFPQSDERILRQAEQLVKEAKSSRQFTDVDKFTLKCMICNVLLKGQVAAQQHAQTTGHASFGEV